MVGRRRKGNNLGGGGGIPKFLGRKREQKKDSSRKTSVHHLRTLNKLVHHKVSALSSGTDSSSKKTRRAAAAANSTGFVAPSYLEETQELQWQDLTPGTTAPDYIPETLRPLWAAGTALGTVFTNIPAILAQGASGGGYHYPGANYIGPMTPIDKNPVPVSQMDDLARIHDYQYAQLVEAGVNPYFSFNEADRYMLAHADLNTAEGWAIYLGIGLKQIFPDDFTPVEAVPPYNRQPFLNGVGEDPTHLRPTLSIQYEESQRNRGKMIQTILQAASGMVQGATNMTTTTMGEEFIQNKNQHQQNVTRATEAAAAPFIQSLLGGVSVNKAQPRSLGKDPFLRLFFSGAVNSPATALQEAFRGGALGPVSRSAAALRSFSNGLRSRSRFLPLSSPARSRWPLTLAKGNVASAASRRNMSVTSLIHKASQRDYKTGRYTQTIDQIQKLPSTSLSSKSHVPSFVRR